MNFRLGGSYRQLRPDYQHNWRAEVRGRLSEDSESDLLQFDSRYSFIRPGRRQSWQVNTGISHLQFGGSSLYTGLDVSARYQRLLVLVMHRARPFFIAPELTWHSNQEEYRVMQT